MTPSMLRKIARETASRFENRHHFPINPAALDVVVSKALPHLGDVSEGLAKGEITTLFIRDSIYIILFNAWTVARERERRAIGEDTVAESMRRYCPYLWWC